MGITIEGKKKKSRRIPGKKIPVIPEYDETPLPSTKEDMERFKQLFRTKPVDITELVKSDRRKTQAEKMATDEFRQSMKKPGAVDKYAKQSFDKDRSKRMREERQKRAKEKGVIQDMIKGRSPYQDVAKGGYVKKYARGGGILRKAR